MVRWRYISLIARDMAEWKRTPITLSEPISLIVGLEVAQVTDVALVVFGSTVGLVVGVD
jgi:hypothetical protein